MSTTTPNLGLTEPTPFSPADANIWGTQLNNSLTVIDSWSLLIATTYIGNTPPSLPALVAGFQWINTNSSSATAWYLQVYDGASWITLGTINPTAHTWTPAGIGNSMVAVQTFTASGTYTPTAGMTQCLIEIVGGGGGGGGSLSTGGGGGGAGEYARGLFTAATIGVSQAITIGAAGSGASNATSNGTAGSTTSVGTLMTALGGSFGASNNHASATSVGGTGGSGGTGGQLRISGQPGGYGSDLDGSVLGGVSGGGGSSFFGFGAVSISNPLSSVTNGVAGTGFGSGGSGGAGSGGSAAGGNGTSGYVIITEYL